MKTEEEIKVLKARITLLENQVSGLYSLLRDAGGDLRNDFGYIVEKMLINLLGEDGCDCITYSSKIYADEGDHYNKELGRWERTESNGATYDENTGIWSCDECFHHAEILGECRNLMWIRSNLLEWYDEHCFYLS